MRILILGLIMVFLYSCASASWTPQSSHEDSIFSQKVSTYSELRTELDSFKGEAMNIETGEKVLEGNFPSEIGGYRNAPFFKRTLLERCKKYTGSECRISRFMDEVYYASHEELVARISWERQLVLDNASEAEQLITSTELEAIKNEDVELYTALQEAKQNRVQQELSKKMEEINDYQERRLQTLEDNHQKELERIEDEKIKRMTVIQALKDRCISYGFEGNNNIAACVQREAQHDYEIEQKEYELRLVKAKLDSLTAQQTYVEEEPSLWLSILGALAEGAAEGYKQSQVINALDQRYDKKYRDIYRYCRPNC